MRPTIGLPPVSFSASSADRPTTSPIRIIACGGGRFRPLLFFVAASLSRHRPIPSNCFQPRHFPTESCIPPISLRQANAANRVCLLNSTPFIAGFSNGLQILHENDGHSLVQNFYPPGNDGDQIGQLVGYFFDQFCSLCPHFNHFSCIRSGTRLPVWPVLGPALLPWQTGL